MTHRFPPLVLLFCCGLCWCCGVAATAVAQVTITPVGNEPLVQIDPRAPDNGVNIRRAPSGDPESSGDSFCAQLWLLGERGFFADAAKGRPLTFAQVRVAQRGRAFFAAIFFGNATSSGVAATPSVSYDITVRRPDGTIYSEKLGLVGSSAAPSPQPTPAGRGAATPATIARAATSESEPAAGAGGTVSSADAPSPSLRLGRDYLGIVIEPSDPAGLYTVEAVVRDNVGRAELKLKTDFLVEAASAPATAPPAQ